MEISPRFQDDELVKLFFLEIQRGKNSSYPYNYIGAWEKITLKGVDNYSIDDMDTTIICTLLKRSDAFDPYVDYRIRRNLDNLQSDRNIDAHITGNETDFELFQWACAALHNIEKFLDTVWKYSCASNSDKLAYKQKHQRDIEGILRDLEEDYRESIKLQEIELTLEQDLCDIRVSKNPQLTYCDICKKYLDSHDMELYNKFIFRAADQGIIYACGIAGDICFLGLMTQKDYKKAEEYYSKGFSELSPPEKLNLAGIYMNNLSSSHTAQEGMEILKSCENPRWRIVPYHTEEGSEFYRIERKTKQ